jgi:Icc-related predicted phosphoesterase
MAEARALIPPGLDVLVTHGPGYGRLDRTVRGDRVGCEVLANRLGALAKEKHGPRLHVHGDIHEASGIRRPREGRPGRVTVNAAVLDARYRPAFAPRIVDLPVR